MGSHHIVVLLSGRGSNLAALLAAAEREGWADTLGVRVAAVVSNVPNAAGLAVARAADLPTLVVPHAAFGARAAFESALSAAIDAHAPALIILAGFMRVLTPPFVERYAGRLINIHPSLLPAFPGLNTHRRALAAGVRVHGATVHFVTPDVDSGAIIAQAAVPVLPDDDEATLAERVLEQEHRLLPHAVRLVLEGRVRCDGERVALHGIVDGELTLLAS